MNDESFKVSHSHAAEKDALEPKSIASSISCSMKIVKMQVQRFKSGHYIAHAVAYWPSRQPTGALEPPVIPGCNLCLHDITNLPPAKSSFNLEEHTLLFCGGVTRPLGGPDHLIAPPGPIHQTMGWVKGHRRESNPCT